MGDVTRVLLVDDDENLRLVCRMRLELAGLEVHTAEDGVAALAVLRGWVPDVIVTDLNMPRMDGFDLLGAIGACGRLCEVPVVVLTATDSDHNRRRARQLGATRVLAKGHDVLVALEAAIAQAAQAP